MSKTPENTEYTGAVGALVTCEINGKKYSILQKRPKFKPDGTPESFPGCLQVTVHGGLEGKNRKERESMLDGLKREVREEVQEMLTRSATYQNPISTDEEDERRGLEYIGKHPEQTFQQKPQILAVSRKKKIATNQHEKNIRKTDVTLGFHTLGSKIGVDAIRVLQKEGIIVLLSADEIDKLVPLDPKLHKKDGIKEEGKYGMFSDEIEAVKKALIR